MKKLISLLLVFSIINISCATISSNHTKIDPRKKGAELIILKKDGQQIRGELIAVKQNSLLLLDRVSGADVTADIEDVGTIALVRKWNLLKAAGLGFASFLVVLIGTAILADVIGQSVLGEQGPPFIGMIAGLVVFIKGGVSSQKKTIQLEGKSDTEIKEILEKLRNKARMKKAQ